jgi:CHAT domain-containing protein
MSGFLMKPRLNRALTCVGRNWGRVATPAHKLKVVQRWSLLAGYFLLLFLNPISSWTQGLPSPLETRLRSLSTAIGEAAGRECGSLLDALDSIEIAPRIRAGGLDQLRDACSRRLTWTDPLLTRISERALVVRRPLESEQPAALCHALQVLGLSYHYLTRIGEALNLYQEAVAVSRRWRGRGTTDEDVAGALESLSSLLLDLQRFPAALDAAQQSLRLRRQAIPLIPEKVVTSLTVRARVEEKLDLMTAKATLLEAHRLSRELGPMHSPEASRVANNLGEILYHLGQLNEAVALLQEAEKLRLRDPRSGRPERQLASTQLLLGKVFYDLGDYPKAIDYYSKAVQGHLKWLGEDPYRYCDALTGLATVLEESGQWEEALTYQRKALKIRDDAVHSAASASDAQTNGELRLMLARSLTRLGALQRRMGNVGDARGSLERALAIEDGVLAQHPNVDRAQTLVELADYWREVGDQRLARGVIDRCLKDLDMLREGGPLRMQATEVAARVATDPAMGLRTLEQASRLADRLYGKSSPGKASILQVQADLRRRRGDTAGALGDALLSQKLSLPHVKTIVEAFPRDQAMVFAADRRQSLDLALQLVAESPDLKPGLVTEVFQVAASSRMLVRDAEIDRQRLLRAKTSPRLTPIAERLTAARKRFAYLLVQTQGTVETQTGRLRGARQELTEAEAMLATKTRSLLASSSVSAASVQQLRRHLPAKAALVAVYRYHQFTGNEAYMAFVLNGSAQPYAVPLGEAVVVDGLVQRWRATILNSQSSAEARTQAGQALRRAIWDPVVGVLAGTKTVFIVPDGALHIVPLMALPAKNGEYLIEQGWAFHTLTAERDLLEPADSPRPGPWLALGGVDYDRSAVPSIATPEPARELLRDGDPDALSADPLRAGGCRRAGLSFFGSLPGSREEVKDLATFWQHSKVRTEKPAPTLTVLTGRNATEEALRRAVHGQRVVHLATHGFVFADRCDHVRSAIHGLGGLSLSAGPTSVESSSISGLAFAGANDRGRALNSDQDGVLTEEEILDLDLRTADWVVLSACNSGLGRMHPGEGIVGILRAFQVAGAKSVIVSLWPIEDQAARRWMHELYQARFERHLSTIESMRHAALQSLLYFRRQGNDNPAKWAGFMASGHWS